MKKIMALILSLALVLSLAACTSADEDAPEAAEPAATEEIEETGPQETQAEPEEQEPAEPAAGTEPAEPAVTETEPADLFTSVHETVYAASTVNIREGFGADTAKIGSLSRGQSIVRTGIGTGEAEGWSEVKFNGQTAYISSDYLSATKPAAEQSKPGGDSSGGSSGGSSGSQNSSGGQTQTQQPSSQPSGSQNSNDPAAVNPWADVNAERPTDLHGGNRGDMTNEELEQWLDSLGQDLAN